MRVQNLLKYKMKTKIWVEMGRGSLQISFFKSTLVKKVFACFLLPTLCVKANSCSTALATGVHYLTPRASNLAWLNY